jgi:hypothetical protein
MSDKYATEAAVTSEVAIAPDELRAAVFAVYAAIARQGKSGFRGSEFERRQQALHSIDCIPAVPNHVHD